MAKEAFNRKISIFCRSLEKELRKRLLKCFVWSVALYGAETWPLRRNEQKMSGSILRCGYGEGWNVKWTDKIKNAVVLEGVGERRILLALITKRKSN